MLFVNLIILRIIFCTEVQIHSVKKVVKHFFRKYVNESIILMSIKYAYTSRETKKLWNTNCFLSNNIFMNTIHLSYYNDTSLYLYGMFKNNAQL